MSESRPHIAQAGAAGDGWRRGMLRAPAAKQAGGTPSWLVVKVGGSILSRPRWPALLATLLEGIGARPCRLVVGGGAVVDGLRSIDRAAPQPVELIHGLAIDAMRLTARLVACAAGLPLASGIDDAEPRAVLDAPAWLARHAAAAAGLPAGWQVTSDSIAAAVAAQHGCGLLLVKSVPPPPCPEAADAIAAAAAGGWVDGCFPTAAARLAEIAWAAPGAA